MRQLGIVAIQWIAAALAGTPQEAPSLTWFDSFREARQEAAKEWRPILIYIGSKT
jgi:hypothetical protein